MPNELKKEIFFLIEVPDVSDPIIKADGDVIAQEKDVDGRIEKKSFDIKYIVLYESDSREGTYKKIDKFRAVQGVKKYGTREYTDPSHWFKFRFQSSTLVESQFSDPILPDDIDSLILAIRNDVFDNREKKVHDDDYYLRKLRTAAFRHGKYTNFSEIPDHELDLVLMLAKSSICRDLAQASAKFHSLTLPGGLTLQKGEIMRHYLDLAESYDKGYRMAMDNIDTATSEGGIHSVKIRRKDLYSNSDISPSRIRRKLDRMM
jgi:hypothetical protein